jgi:hypothetical protein
MLSSFPSLLPNVAHFPLLCFWCPDDVVVPFSLSAKVVSPFTNSQLVRLSIPASVSLPFLTHLPENDPGNSERFHMEMEAFLKKITNEQAKKL